MKTTLLKLSALGLATTALAPLPLLAKHHEAAEMETMGTIDVAATEAALDAAQIDADRAGRQSLCAESGGGAKNA